MRVDEDSIRNTVTLERGTVAPAAEETPAEDKKTQFGEEEAERDELHEENTLLEEKIVANAPQEFDGDLIVRYVGKGDNVKYVVSWYCYM